MFFFQSVNFSRLKKLSLTSILLFLFTACFDYTEKIVFHEDFSGYIDFNYQVPVYPELDRSLIAFLPVNKKRIRERFKKLLLSEQIRIDPIIVEMQSTGLPAMNDEKDVVDASDIFRRFARVRYRLHFQNPLVLEKILPGQIRVHKRGRQVLHVDRSFQSASKLVDNSNKIVSSVYRVSREMLQDRAMNFKIEFDKNLSITSNKGIKKAQDLTWKLPLERSLYETKKISWKYTLQFASE